MSLHRPRLLACFLTPQCGEQRLAVWSGQADWGELHSRATSFSSRSRDGAEQLRCPQVAKAKLQQKTDVEAATAAGARALEGAHAVVRHRRHSRLYTRLLAALLSPSCDLSR